MLPDGLVDSFRRQQQRTLPSIRAALGSSVAGRVASSDGIAYPEAMYATAVVDGKVVRFKLSPALARAHRENRGKSLSEKEAVAVVEAKRQLQARRRAMQDLQGGD